MWFLEFNACSGEKIYNVIFLTILPVVIHSCYGVENEYAQYVDPYIGTEGDGNVFPGVCTPCRMVKLGPAPSSWGKSPIWNQDK